LIPSKDQFSKGNEWDELEEDVFPVLSRAEMVALQHKSAVKYPNLSLWKVLGLQALVTLISMVVWPFFGEPSEVSLYTSSAFLGGLLSVLPSALFLIRLKMAQKTQILSPGSFLAALVSGQFIKIAVTLMLFVGIAYLAPGVLWVPLLVTYVLVLKCVWLAYLLR
jgi:ATP synthase protein I